MEAFKSTSAALALKPALSCRGSKALDGKAKVSSSLMPQSQRAQVQFWMALCGPPAPSPDGDRVLVGSMPSTMGEDWT